MTGSTAEKVEEQTTSLALTAAELAALRLALSIYVRDLRLEIRHTDSYEFRKELKAQGTLLEGMLHRLGGPAAAGDGEAR